MLVHRTRSEGSIGMAAVSVLFSVPLTVCFAGFETRLAPRCGTCTNSVKFGPQALELRLGMGGVRPWLEGRLQRLVGLTEPLVLEPDVELGQSRVIGRIEHERT